MNKDEISAADRLLLSRTLAVLTYRQLYEISQAVAEVKQRGFGTVSIVVNAKCEHPVLEVTIRSKLSRE